MAYKIKSIKQVREESKNNFIQGRKVRNVEFFQDGKKTYLTIRYKDGLSTDGVVI